MRSPEGQTRGWVGLGLCWVMVWRKKKKKGRGGQTSTRTHKLITIDKLSLHFLGQAWFRVGVGVRVGVRVTVRVGVRVRVRVRFRVRVRVQDRVRVRVYAGRHVHGRPSKDQTKQRKEE